MLSFGESIDFLLVLEILVRLKILDINTIYNRPQYQLSKIKILIQLELLSDAFNRLNIPLETATITNIVAETNAIIAPLSVDNSAE